MDALLGVMELHCLALVKVLLTQVNWRRSLSARTSKGDQKKAADFIFNS